MKRRYLRFAHHGVSAGVMLATVNRVPHLPPPHADRSNDVAPESGLRHSIASVATIGTLLLMSRPVALSAQATAGLPVTEALRESLVLTLLGLTLWGTAAWLRRQRTDDSQDAEPAVVPPVRDGMRRRDAA